MIKKIMLLLIICSGTTWSSAQDVTVWKHILRFSNDRYIPKGYIATKYQYCDTTLLYEMNFSDNGWQVYDSVSYIMNNGLWYVSHYDSDTNSQLYLRYSDTIKSLYYTNGDIQYNTDKYNILSRYLNGINSLISSCKTETHLSVKRYLGDTCCYYFADADYTLLFADYGIPMKENLEKYCCNIGNQGEYDWDFFEFSEYTILRHFDYDNIGNIYKITVTKTRKNSKKKTTWIESFLVQEF